MKDKIIMFIIGLLVGAVLSTGIFYIYTVTNTNNNSNTTQMNGGPGGMPNGEPPEKPDGDSGEPPEKHGENNTQDNSQKADN